MGLSLGWLLLLGGVLGAARVLRAKTFSWVNEVDTVVTDEDRKGETPMTPFERGIPVAICLLLATVGAVLIQKQHNWNLLKPCPSGGQVSGEKACNQALYDAARNHPDTPGSKAVQWWLVNGSQNTPGVGYILHPGSEAVPW